MAINFVTERIKLKEEEIDIYFEAEFQLRVVTNVLHYGLYDLTEGCDFKNNIVLKEIVVTEGHTKRRFYGFIDLDDYENDENKYWKMMDYGKTWMVTDCEFDSEIKHKIKQWEERMKELGYEVVKHGKCKYESKM